MVVALHAIVGAGLGWAIGGTLGLVAGTLSGAAIVLAPRLLFAAALSGPVMLAVLTLTEATLTDGLIGVFPAVRPRAHDAGIVLVIAWLATAVVVWRGNTTNPTVTQPPSRGRRRWPLLLLVLLAVVGTLASID